MTTNRVQANYAELDAVAKHFDSLSDESAKLAGQVRQRAEELIQNGWIGLGADSFAAEMNNTLLPTMQRLVNALAAAQRVTLLASRTLQAAEEEASGLFVGESAGGSIDDSRTPTTPAGQNGAGDGHSPASEQRGEQSGGGLKGSVKLLELDRSEPESSGESKLGFRYGVYEGDLWSKTFEGTQQAGSVTHNEALKVSLGAYDVGAEASISKKGLTIGPYGEFTTIKVEHEDVIGDEDLGFTRTDEVKGPGADALLGYKDGSAGAYIGFSAVSAKSEMGVNVAGVNVGVSAEVGLKAEYGLKIGKEIEIKLPFFSFGVSFGDAKDGKL